MSCVLERSTELQLFLWSFKLLSMAAILCFSQHCLTWNFRAENSTTVFTMFEAKTEIHIKGSDENTLINPRKLYENVF